ncbi:hypothetical protein L596_022229 [Steinernema carpocapsae]|uniref:Uncharacterized protein n=1 Tax=Steinernema carpocapsae TaxID=34508 RepID=A0A4U5ML64_STECR|nr:hypothetical protein L596_022229 [Steinernema carpocapsae]
MDHIPLDFIDHVSLLFAPDITHLREFRKISGIYNYFAEGSLNHGHTTAILIRDGKVVNVCDYDNAAAITTRQPARFKRSTFVILSKNDDTAKINVNLFERIFRCRGMFGLTIGSCILGKTWLDFISTWKTLIRVSITVPFNAAMSNLLDKLVQGGHLKTLSFRTAVYGPKEIGHACDLLKQSQFRVLRIFHFKQELYDASMKLWERGRSDLTNKKIEFFNFTPHQIKDTRKADITRKNTNTVVCKFEEETGIVSRLTFIYNLAKADTQDIAVVVLADRLNLTFK